MTILEEKLELYLKAGLSKQKILLKIDEEFGPEAKAIALRIIDKSYREKKSSSMHIIIGILGIVLIFVIIIGVVMYLSYIQNSAFVSQKCGTKSITITGDAMYRGKLVTTLAFIENKDCNYTRFVLSNLTTIYATDPGMFYSGQQNGDKTLIAIYSGSDEYVAGIVVHEACHAFANNSSITFSEGDCAFTQYNFLKSIGASESDLKKMETSTQTFLQYKFDETNKDAFEVWLETNDKN